MALLRPGILSPDHGGKGPTVTDALQLGFAGMGAVGPPAAAARKILSGSDCPWPITELQRELLRILIFHLGAHRAISLRDLAGKLGPAGKHLPSEGGRKDAARSSRGHFRGK